MWISCLLSAKRYTGRGFQASGQKIDNSRCYPLLLCLTLELRCFKKVFHKEGPRCISCAHSLLADVWITCSLSAVGHAERGVQGFVRKLINGRWVDDVSTSPQLLWVCLWITCSCLATRLCRHGVRALDQIMITGWKYLVIHSLQAGVVTAPVAG